MWRRAPPRVLCPSCAGQGFGKVKDAPAAKKPRKKASTTDEAGPVPQSGVLALAWLAVVYTGI